MSKMVFVLLMAIFLGSVESRAAEKIRISVSGGYNMIFLSSSVAQHRGFFKDEGLDADIIVMGRRDQSLDQGEPLHSRQS